MCFLFTAKCLNRTAFLIVCTHLPCLLLSEQGELQDRCINTVTKACTSRESDKLFSPSFNFRYIFLTSPSFVTVTLFWMVLPQATTARKQHARLTSNLMILCATNQDRFIQDFVLNSDRLLQQLKRSDVPITKRSHAGQSGRVLHTFT